MAAEGHHTLDRDKHTVFKDVFISEIYNHFNVNLTPQVLMTGKL